LYSYDHNPLSATRLYKFDVILLILLNFSDHQVAITRTVDRRPEFDNLAELHHDELRQTKYDKGIFP
jgi:hypothetical protein